MGYKNKHGLSRYIPTDDKQKIRRNSKFGCVVPNCRNAFYEYEHIIPEFKDAKEHNPEKMCLVCPNHNPRRKGQAGQENYSKEQIFDFYRKIKSEEDVPDIVNKTFFHGFDEEPKIVVGKSTFYHISSIFNVNGEDVFSFRKTAHENPFKPNITFSGKFNDSKGKQLFQIVNNEWSSHTDHWDLKTKNGEITIWDNSEEIVFHALKKPGENTIIIDELNMWFPPFHICIHNNNLHVGRYSEDKQNWIYLVIQADFGYGKCAVYLDSKNLDNPVCWGGVQVIGGEGAILRKNGIWIGKKSERCYLRNWGVSTSGSLPKLVEKNETKIPENAHCFVKGKLEIKEVEYPNWTEREFYLNGQKLRNKPYSWGKISEDGEHLYYVSRTESEGLTQESKDLTEDDGFIGYYAEDILEQEWSDKVFEALVEELGPDGEKIRKRVKRSEIGDKKIISEINDETGHYYHPQQFVGISPWKEIEEDT
jgi:hypothetical protein